MDDVILQGLFIRTIRSGDASDKKYKLEDCDEKRELPIKAAFARKTASNCSPLKFGNLVLIRAISQQCPVYCNMRQRQFVY